MKSETILVRKYSDRDLKAVLGLIGKSDSTDRSEETWAGNDMTALLAFEGEDLVGIIPFEKRRVVLNKNSRLNALWVSAAHVEPAYRGQGIGTKLDHAIKDEFSPEFEAIFVIREDEESAAYRWYKKLGYQQLSNIFSLKCDVVPAEDNVEFTLLTTPQEFQRYGAGLKQCFDAHLGSGGGYPQREDGFWAKKSRVHYYREHYVYSIVAIEGGENTGIQAYAFLGRTNLRDGIDRLDILELIVPPDGQVRRDLFHAILAYANRINCQQLRVQCAEHDPLMEWFKGLGFVVRWQTNLLGKYIGSDKKFTGVNWKFFHIDYI